MERIDRMPVFGRHETTTLQRARLGRRPVHRFALMADDHLGQGVLMGGLICSESRISLIAVVFAIACGNRAVRLDIPGAELRANIERVMDAIWQALSLGRGA